MKKHSLLLLLILLIPFLNACNWKRKADLVIHNGKIYTVNQTFTIVQAMAIREGRILAIGSNQDILSGFQATETIDLKGQTVYPGFIDAHCHFVGYGSDLIKLDLSGTKSFDEILLRTTEFEKSNSFDWILGRGWDQNDWENSSYPDNVLLDSLFPDKPVFLLRIDGHAALCNSVALGLAGLTPNEKINGGEVVSQNGIMTGLLIDNAIDRVRSKIPVFSMDVLEEGILRAQDSCFSYGLTTVSDAGLGRDSIELIQRLQKEGKLKMRIYAMLSDEISTLKYYFREGPIKTDRLTVRAVKIYGDGALGSRGACLRKDYADQPGHRGFLLRSPEFMKEVAEHAIDNGFQLCTHAIGDSALKVVLDVYSEFLRTDNNRRWRVEHCQVISPKDLRYFTEYNIIPSVQPTHATSDMYWAEKRLGPDRIKNAYAYRYLMNAADGMIALGTDFPVEKINPFLTFYAATQRKDLNGFPPDGFQRENRLKKKDAIRGMTIWAAYANFEEENKGSLEEGKFADFIIVDKDILEIDEKEIPFTKVLSTYVNGEKVFQRSE